MSGKRQIRKLKSKDMERFSYSCSRYNKSGPLGCVGYGVNEREVLNAVLPVFVELPQTNLRDHLAIASTTNRFQKQTDGEQQDAKRRLEKRLNGLRDATRLQKEVSAVLQVFDHDLLSMLTDLMKDRLRFNTFLRLFFSDLEIEVDRPGVGWRKGKRKGEVSDCNAYIKKFALSCTLQNS